MQRLDGDSSIMHQTNSQPRDERRLLCRLGENCIARGQCGRRLPGEDGKRKILR